MLEQKTVYLVVMFVLTIGHLHVKMDLDSCFLLGIISVLTIIISVYQYVQSRLSKLSI